MSTPAKHHSPGFLALVNEAKGRIREIDIDEYQRLRERGEAGQLVDVREDHEWHLALLAGCTAPVRSHFSYAYRSRCNLRHTVLRPISRRP